MACQGCVINGASRSRFAVSVQTLRVSVLVVAAGCGSSSPVNPPDASPPDAVIAPPRLTWSPCPVISGGTGTGAECGVADLPLHWDQPDGARIDVFVKRVGPIDAGTQMWMLNGGPGASGADFDTLAEPLVDNGDLVVYLLDHRGTGRSTRLGCSGEADASPGGFEILDEEWEACGDELAATWGDGLAGFTTTAAARDLGWMLAETARPGQAVNIWGGSYGTRWAQRYLQLEPAGASSVTLMGVVTADRSFADYDVHYDTTGHAFLARCGDDAFCASRLGPDPVARVDALWTALDGGQCAAAGLDKRTLRTFFATLMLSYWEERALIPAILARLERCNASDVAALSYLAAVLATPGEPSTADRLSSSVLGTHVGTSEFWPGGAPPLADLIAIDEAAVVSFGTAPRQAARLATWPRTPVDQYAGAYPDTSLPVLIINGQFDPATPEVHAHEVATHYTRADQRLIVGPDATHAFASPTTEGYWCFLVLMVAFAESPTAPDIPCAADMLPMDFHGTPAIAAYLGTTDLWDGGPSATVAPPAPPAGAAELRRRIARGRRGLR
jgi:pimeloyl-ACP methyl ester carboxylesterase